MHHFSRSLSVLVTLVATFSAVSLAFSLEPEQIWERVSPSVVRVEATLFDGEQIQGTGFVCEMDGKKYILSNRHVVAGAKEVHVGDSAGKMAPSPGYRISPELDLAVIEVPKEMKGLALSKRTTVVRTGERVYAIGFPLGLNKSITQGLISSQTEKVIQFDAPISSGSSGGPLVDKEGLAVGIVTAGSSGSAEHLAQNLNFAIKTAFIPKATLFQDPIVSFYDAWLELVRIENALIDGLKTETVFEVHKYLETQAAAAILFTEAQSNSDGVRRLEESQMECLRRIVAKQGSVEQASKRATAYLRKQISDFDKIPGLFIALGRQELLKEFTRDNRPSSLFRYELDESEIAPLLRTSLEHVKAKYEDMAYQIEFLTDFLPRLRKKDADLIKQFRDAEQSLAKWERDTVRLPYATLLKQSGDRERLLLFFKSNARYRSPAIVEKFFDGSLSARERFASSGGLEGEITTMFQRLAIARMHNGNLEKAMGYIRNEISQRKFGDYRLLAHFTAAAGDFEAAYKLHEKAFIMSAEMLDPFELTLSGNIRRKLIASEFQDDGRRYTAYPVKARENLIRWHEHLLGKEEFALMNLSAFEDALMSKAFRAMSEFQQFLILDAWQRKTPFKEFQRFWKAVHADPVASRVYDKYLD